MQKPLLFSIHACIKNLPSIIHLSLHYYKLKIYTLMFSLNRGRFIFYVISLPCHLLPSGLRRRMLYTILIIILNYHYCYYHCRILFRYCSSRMYKYLLQGLLSLVYRAINGQQRAMRSPAL